MDDFESISEGAKGMEEAPDPVGSAIADAAYFLKSKL